MFDMKSNSKDGYELRIRYSVKQDKYFLTGYVVERGKDNATKFYEDGAPLEFSRLGDALEHIIDYKAD